jgi:hypothetical protein
MMAQFCSEPLKFPHIVMSFLVHIESVGSVILVFQNRLRFAVYNGVGRAGVLQTVLRPAPARADGLDWPVGASKGVNAFSVAQV